MPSRKDPRVPPPGDEGEIPPDEMAEMRDAGSEFDSNQPPAGGGRQRSARFGNGSIPIPLPVRLSRTELSAHPDVFTWWAIEESTLALAFDNYKLHVDLVLCSTPDQLQNLLSRVQDDQYGQTMGRDGRTLRRFLESIDQAGVIGQRHLPLADTDAYQLLKAATEAFVAVYGGVKLDYVDDEFAEQREQILRRVDASGEIDLEEAWKDSTIDGHRILPYILAVRRKLPPSSFERISFSNFDVERRIDDECYALLRKRLQKPFMIELLWSFWIEQAMVAQTMNAISRRFQNVHGPFDRDPLGGMELDFVRPISNVLWGFVNDEVNRLSIVRRAYEYDHEYGLTLEGKAVPRLRPADSRSKFLEAFHNLLQLCSAFFKQDDDTTVRADAFPILNALKDVHMLLAEGAHNQFPDLPVRTRIEFMIQQWLLSRPEFREVLPSRTSVIYPEPWMERVDAMKRLQGWGDTNVTHFRNLAVFGEKILLTIRFGSWSTIDDPNEAALWARWWRPQIQGYIHAYRSVTGVDLAPSVGQTQDRSLIAMQPSTLLIQRLNGAEPLSLPASSSPALAAPNGFRTRRAART